MSIFGGVPGEDEKEGKKDVTILSVEKDSIDSDLGNPPEEYLEKREEIIEEHYGEGGIVTEYPDSIEGIYRNLDEEGQRKMDKLHKEHGLEPLSQ